MGSEGQLSRLRTVAHGFKKIDKDKLLRPSLGEASIKEAFGERLEFIIRKIEFATEFGKHVHDSTLSQVAAHFEQILQLMQAHAGRNNPEYVTQRDNFLAQIDGSLEQLLQYWSPFVTAAIESRGFLQDEGIRKEYQRTIDLMKEESTGALKLVKDEASKTIQEARELAKQIEERARRTAARISVEAAQEQFRLAQEDLKARVKLWSWLSGSAILAFLAAAICLAFVDIPKEKDLVWPVVYFTAIRITILAAIGAVAAFCLRVFRAHMHMFQHNLHRQRIANSMAAFVESAITPEQRDLILAHLVDAVSAFGTSGLLGKEDDGLNTPKMMIDSITRTLPSSGSKA